MHSLRSRRAKRRPSTPALADAVLPEAGAEEGEPEQQSPEPLALIGEAELRGALEAILLVVDEPVSEIVLAQVLEQPTERVAAMLGGLSRRSTRRPGAASSCAGPPAAGGCTPGRSTPRTWSGSCWTGSRCG